MTWRLSYNHWPIVQGHQNNKTRDITYTILNNTENWKLNYLIRCPIANTRVNHSKKAKLNIMHVTVNFLGHFFRSGKYNVHNYIPSLLPFETVYSMFCNTTVCSHILLNWFSQLYKLIWYIPSCLIQTSLNLLRSCQSFGLTDMKILSVRKIFCRSE
jgi:hypothetical protein